MDADNISTNGNNGAGPTRHGAALAAAPRTAAEATWSFPSGAILPPHSFGSRPTSSAIAVGDRHPLRDIVAAAFVAIALGVLGGVYVTGGFDGEAHKNPRTTTDPFAVAPTER